MQQHKWYSLLRKTDWYNELIAQRYLEVKDYIEETVEHIAYMADTYHEGFIRNFERWDIWDQQINREPSNVMKIKYFDGQVEYLKNWLTKREEWLTKFYNGEVKDIKKGNSRW